MMEQMHSQTKQDLNLLAGKKNLNGNSTLPIKVSHSIPTTIYDYIANSLESTANFLGIKPSLNSTINFIDNKSKSTIKISFG